MINYLAGPYSSVHIHIRERRYNQISFVAAQLMKRGECIYSPITSCHHIAIDYDLPFDTNFWLNHDLAILARCDKLLVLQLEGWEHSIGVQCEIAFADEHNIPVEYVTLEDFVGENN